MRDGKIIDTLRQRREIEAQIRRLLELKSQDEIAAHADVIAAQGDLVIPTLIANLDTTNPHFRGALGVVAEHLPHAAVAAALQAATRDESLSDQARLTAVMILERFLHEEVDGAALAGLDDPRQVALHSLLEVIGESEQDRSIMLEYLRSFREQPSEVADLVLQALDDIPPESQAEMLRLMAQDERPAIRDRALGMLGRNRTPAARRALQLLLPTLPADLQPAIERSLRKLALAGIAGAPLPPPDPSWRTLISPVDGQGNQSIWFLQEQPDGGQCRFLSILISDRQGLHDAFGGDNITGQHFPKPAPLGTLHTVPLHKSAVNLNLLEAEFDYGRRLVLLGLARNHEQGTPTPLEYRLLGDFLWSYATDSIRSEPLLPDVPPAQFDLLLSRSAKLLELPDFATWFVQSHTLYEHASRLRSMAASGVVAAVPRQWLAELATTHFADEEVRRLYQERLQAMSEWLLLSHQGEASRLSLAAALGIERVPPAEHPLLLRLIQNGLSVAIRNLSHGLDLRALYPHD